jgi:DNA polymerase IV
MSNVPQISTGRSILHVDMDAFYASVEMRDDPSLRGKPVIVGGTPEGRGVVSAASYEARAFGVHSAMTAVRARQLCPHGIFLRGRMDRYMEVSHQIQSIFHDFTPLVEPLSVDEAFLDVSGCRRLFGSAENIGLLIKNRIADELELVASVGVAPNKFLAKLASDLDKPDGFVVISAAEAPGLLAELPVERLWGVGKVARQNLNSLGIRKVKDLQAFPVEILVAKFGDHIHHLLELAVGYDERPVVPTHKAKSIGNEITFREDIADAMVLSEVVAHLADKVARRLRAHEFSARTITLKARYSDFTTLTRAAACPEPTNSSVAIRDMALHLLRHKVDRRGRALRLVGVTASNLLQGRQIQGDLFPDPEKMKNKKLDGILDEVHERLGGKLSRGMGLKGRPGAPGIAGDPDAPHTKPNPPRD